MSRLLQHSNAIRNESDETLASIAREQSAPVWKWLEGACFVVALVSAILAGIAYQGRRDVFSSSPDALAEGRAMQAIGPSFELEEGSFFQERHATRNHN